jgi:phenylalanyl-tRNA synthetase alpha chain
MSVENAMLQQLDAIQQAALAELQRVGDDAALQAWKVAHLGRSSAVMQTFSQLPGLPKEMRPGVGQAANRVKLALEGAFGEKSEALKQTALARSLTEERVDVSLPGRQQPLGRLHPETTTLREIYRAFASMGFQVFRTREVETDDNNFGLLNIPPHHPARDMWSTFLTTRPGILLRTHTSNSQIHAMHRYAPKPIRVILPGMCYRYEQVSVRRDYQFTQLEGIMIGEQVTLGDLKGTLNEFCRQMFGAGVQTRFRPSYFPFTEPSGELDVECFVCGGKGCAMCKSSGWLEILGCGMIHPRVLQNGGYDPDKVTGFAFGMGPGRVTILRHAISDIRYFYENDIRFLEQF